MRKSCTSFPRFVRDERGTATAELAILLPLYLLLLLGSFQLADVSFAVQATTMEARRQAWGGQGLQVDLPVLADGQLSGRAGLVAADQVYDSSRDVQQFLQQAKMMPENLDKDDLVDLLKYEWTQDNAGWLKAVRGDADYSYRTVTSEFTGMLKLDDLELSRSAMTLQRNGGVDRPEIIFEPDDKFDSKLLAKLKDLQGSEGDHVLPKPVADLKPFWNTGFAEDLYPNTR